MGDSGVKCLVCCCGRETYENTEYCTAHNAQIKRTGTLKHHRKDPNRYFIYGDIVKIEIYDKYHNPRTDMVIVDKSDFNKIEGMRIVYQETKTSRRIKAYPEQGVSKSVPIARLIMDAPDGMLVDHKDENIFNNRRSNLRICTKSQNNANRKGTAGVWYHKKNRNWCAEIQINKIKTRLGSFATKELALEARRKAEKVYFGEFAPERK